MRSFSVIAADAFAANIGLVQQGFVGALCGSSVAGCDTARPLRMNDGVSVDGMEPVVGALLDVTD
jgi:hypothetical protein